MNKTIIGLTGRASCGKDTAAIIIKLANTDTDIFAFAGPLKDACKILFNFSEDQLHDPIVKEQRDNRWNYSPREIFQWLGTDILREQINKDFFIINMKQRIESSQAEYIVISDIRFDNEAEFIRSLGGKIIKIERDGKTTEHRNHVTEKGISEKLIDVCIENNLSIEEFNAAILAAVDVFHSG